ncbi:hypothetical protein PQR02_31920 [Paraburkholderia sediminicola]|uniref:Uncharacterized protein n=1 Tax=Paraburkholderia rhynchosiae TaxID=487049 RepID=A0ACC7NLE3_9BURK
MRKIGQLIVLMAFAPTAYAAGSYVEVWNPPEARASAPHHVKTAHKAALHRRGAMHAIKLYTRRAPTPAAKLATKTNPRENLPPHAPDMSEIPRQITPEGNVLRVDSRSMSAELIR